MLELSYSRKVSEKHFSGGTRWSPSRTDMRNAHGVPSLPLVGFALVGSQTITAWKEGIKGK